MHILAIETSCDETSIAIIEGNEKAKEAKILSNVVSSQVKVHAKWGGVVPNLAAREHLKNITPVLEKALEQASKKLSDIDLFAVTQGPGLIPALLIGTNVAKTLSYVAKKPLMGIHHVEGHVFANFIGEKLKVKSEKLKVEAQKTKFPMLALVVSGGHTQLILMRKELEYEIIGQSQDDAAGEAFDKVAKMLELGYPGGPIVSERADNFAKTIKSINDKKLGEELEGISFPRPMLASGDFNFSFSGLKTAVLYYYKNFEKKLSNSENFSTHYSLQTIHSLFQDAICHEFQKAAIEVLVAKTIKAEKKYSPREVILAGGVAANKQLRNDLQRAVRSLDNNISYSVPDFSLCGDNAAMIGVAAFHRFLKIKKNGRLAELDKNWRMLEADANMKLTSI